MPRRRQFKELEVEVDMALLEARCGFFCLKAKYEGHDVAPRNFLPVGAPFGLQAYVGVLKVIHGEEDIENIPVDEAIHIASYLDCPFIMDQILSKVLSPRTAAKILVRCVELYGKASKYTLSVFEYLATFNFTPLLALAAIRLGKTGGYSACWLNRHLRKAAWVYRTKRWSMAVSSLCWFCGEDFALRDFEVTAWCGYMEMPCCPVALHRECFRLRVAEGRSECPLCYEEVTE